LRVSILIMLFRSTASIYIELKTVTCERRDIEIPAVCSRVPHSRYPGLDPVRRRSAGRQNVFFENRLGGYAARQDNTNITGFNGQVGVMAFLPYWIPYRPSFRLALALMTANPVISEPVREFRPSQTVFYFVAGVGITRSLSADFQIEAGADILFSPYNYRVYEFYRQYVEVRETRFTHLAFFIGASYTF